jgi:hypothetical protein
MMPVTPTTELVQMPQDGRSDLAMARAPEAVLAEAQKAAQALQKVIAGKVKPVIINGKQYLEFEDWQTIARFYGLAAMVEKTDYLELGKARGFTARANVVNVNTGLVVSAAEAMCMDDEEWSRKGHKELNHLRSMAQTRACGKALRNVLGWVVVLAGYGTTPSEEMPHDAESRPGPKRPAQAAAGAPAGNLISDAQRKRLYAISKEANVTAEDMTAMLSEYGFADSASITRDKYDEICDRVGNGG